MMSILDYFINSKILNFLVVFSLTVIIYIRIKIITGSEKITKKWEKIENSYKLPQHGSL